MSRIGIIFDELKRRNEGALIAYITAGDPNLSMTPKLTKVLIDGGADIVELGVPFSDPIADGPTIQASSLRALRAGTTPASVLKIAGVIRETVSTPIVLLTYFNPVYRMGLERFFILCRRNGVDGVIVPDLPVEEAGDYKRTAEAYGVDTIFLAAPSTSPPRLRRIANFTTGFLYLVSVFGVTGARETIQAVTIRLVRKTSDYTEGKIPLAVGFGVSKPEHVKALLKSGADGAIVGSALVKLIERYKTNPDRMLKKIEERTALLKGGTKRD